MRLCRRHGGVQARFSSQNCLNSASVAGLSCPIRGHTHTHPAHSQPTQGWTCCCLGPWCCRTGQLLLNSAQFLLPVFGQNERLVYGCPSTDHHPTSEGSLSTHTSSTESAGDAVNLAGRPLLGRLTAVPSSLHLQIMAVTTAA